MVKTILMVQKNFIGLCSEYTDFFSMFMSELIGWAEFGEDKCIRRKKNKTQKKIIVIWTIFT